MSIRSRSPHRRPNGAGYRQRLTVAAALTAFLTLLGLVAGTSAFAQTGPGTPPYWARSPFIVPAGVGASVPFTEYEAESAATNGTIIGPDFTQGDLATEASGREAVQLSAQGQYVQFTLTKAANAFDVHYAVPQGASGTLSVYVNGSKLSRELSLTSAYSYITTLNITGSKTHKFYDDARMMFGQTLAAGSTVKLQVDSTDTGHLPRKFAAAGQQGDHRGCRRLVLDNTSAVSGPVNLSGFAILGSTVGRHDDSTANAINGSLGSGWTVNGLWIQDTNVGFWLQYGNSGCTVENSVIESTDTSDVGEGTCGPSPSALRRS